MCQKVQWIIPNTKHRQDQVHAFSWEFIVNENCTHLTRSHFRHSSLVRPPYTLQQPADGSQMSKIDFLHVNWQCHVDGTQEAELRSAEVQCSWWHAHNKKTWDVSWMSVLTNNSWVEIQPQLRVRSVSCGKVWDIQINLWYKHFHQPSTSCSCINVQHVCCYGNTILFLLGLCKAACLLANVTFQLTCHISCICFID